MVQAARRVVGAYLEVDADAAAAPRLFDDELDQSRADAAAAQLVADLEREQVHRAVGVGAQADSADGPAGEVGHVELAPALLLLAPAIGQLRLGDLFDAAGQLGQLVAAQASHADL